MRPHIFIRGLVRRSVGWSVGNAFVKIGENVFLQVLDDLHCFEASQRRKGQGGGSAEEEGVMRTEEQRGGMSNEED